MITKKNQRKRFLVSQNACSIMQEWGISICHAELLRNFVKQSSNNVVIPFSSATVSLKLRIKQCYAYLHAVISKYIEHTISLIIWAWALRFVLLWSYIPQRPESSDRSRRYFAHLANFFNDMPNSSLSEDMSLRRSADYLSCSNYYYLLLERFSHQFKLRVFQCSPSKN